MTKEKYNYFFTWKECKEKDEENNAKKWFSFVFCKLEMNISFERIKI